MKIKKTFAGLLISTSLLLSPVFANKDDILQFEYGAFPLVKEVYETPHAIKARDATKDFNDYKAQTKEAVQVSPDKKTIDECHLLLQSTIKGWEAATDIETAPYAKGLLLTQARDSIDTFLSEDTFKYCSFEKGLKRQKEDLSKRISEFYEEQARLEQNPAAKAAWLVTSAKQLRLPETNGSNSWFQPHSPLSFFERGIKLYEEAGKSYEKASIDGPIDSIYARPLKSLATFNLEINEEVLPALPGVLASLCYRNVGFYTHSLWFHKNYPNGESESKEGSSNYEDIAASLKKNFSKSASLMATVADSSEKIDTGTKARLMREAAKTMSKSLAIPANDKTYNIKPLERQYGRYLEDAYSLYETALDELQTSEPTNQWRKPHLLVRLADIRYEQASIPTCSLTQREKFLEGAQDQLKQAQQLSPNIEFNDPVWHRRYFGRNHRSFWLDKLIDNLLETVKKELPKPESN